MPAGDSVLRHDVQVLADRGIISGPVTSWPLAWGPILAQIDNIDTSQSLPADVIAALERTRRRAAWETRVNELTYSANVAAADSPQRIRGFENTPRENAEIGGGLSWTGDRISVTLKGQYVDPVNGSSAGWADGSMIGVALGNWSLSANTLERWWGPGWDGSLILSNNARPVPAISIDRNFTDAFKSRWLHWLGPWDLSVTMGQLESDRTIPNALFFGMRFNFKPLSSLEIGLSRTAQWCGDGRPCDAGTFADLLLGQDNRGDAGISADNEPGNQLAGIDLRWAPMWFEWPVAFYGQFIGEDEAGGFPSQYLGLAGIEASGIWQESWSWRWFGEFAGTACRFHQSNESFNCAYNHGTYRTGYRYRDRGIGHGADNDARLISSGITLVNTNETQWGLLIRYGELNRGGGPDTRNTVSPVAEDIASVDLSHARVINYGVIEAGIGFEMTDNALTGKDDDVRFFLRWQSAY